MKKLLIIPFLVIGLAISQMANAQAQQGDAYMNLFYSTALPTGGFKSNFIDRTSWRGTAIDLMWYSNPKLALGLGFSYQDFIKKLHVSYMLLQMVRTFPLFAVVPYKLSLYCFKATYYPLKMKEPVKAGSNLHNGFQAIPYFNAGAGMNLVAYQQLLGIFTNVDNFKLGFAAQAGVGVKFPFGRFMQNGFLLEGNYNLMPFNQYVMTNLNHFNFRLGFQFEMQ